MTGVENQVCVHVECMAKNHNLRWAVRSRQKRYCLLILFAEFVLEANLDFLNGEIRKPTLIFERPRLAAGLGEPSLHLPVSVAYGCANATGRGCVGR